MSHTIKSFLKFAACIALIIYTTSARAQSSIIQSILDKVQGFNSLSYKSLYKQKDDVGDTLVRNAQDILLKIPEEKTVGYFFSTTEKLSTNKFPSTDLFFGDNLVTLSPNDSVYTTSKMQARAFNLTAVYKLKWINDFVKSHPASLTKVKDSVINAVAYDHFTIITGDTTVNKQRLVMRWHLLADKNTGLPKAVITKGQHAGYGNGITSVYSAYEYYDYKINDPGIDLAKFSIPKGYHPPKKQAAPPALLAAGTDAPDWTLYDVNGKKTSLNNMKGKIVLMDFYFIGCAPCMQSLKPLSNLYKKYKDRLIIASLTQRDSKEDVAAFDKLHKIAYAGFADAAEVVKAYHVSGWPTFYFIDKNGKIANVLDGFDEQTEIKMEAIIKALVKKG
ncbi:hypothetical protein GCM10027049_21310 [Mucilaginibacter puniceus]